MALALIFLFLVDSWKDGVLKNSCVKCSEKMPQEVPNQYIEKKCVCLVTLTGQGTIHEQEMT